MVSCGRSTRRDIERCLLEPPDHLTFCRNVANGISSRGLLVAKGNDGIRWASFTGGVKWVLQLISKGRQKGDKQTRQRKLPTFLRLVTLRKYPSHQWYLENRPSPQPSQISVDTREFCGSNNLKWPLWVPRCQRLYLHFKGSHAGPFQGAGGIKQERTFRAWQFSYLHQNVPQRQREVDVSSVNPEEAHNRHRFSWGSIYMLQSFYSRPTRAIYFINKMLLVT